MAAESPAARAGLQIGDELLAVDGQVPRDVIAYRLLVDEADPVVALRRRGREELVTVRKDAGEALGVEVSSAVFDRVKTCDNHCEFCFIYQLPKQMRRSLYLKDDDYRLSFLYGNFTTLTRFTELDLERVVRDGLSPLYVSIHTTDPELRARMLRNRRGAVSLRWLRALLDAGVEVHGQVVVCPGVNDGEALDATLAGILDEYPELASAACVPLGISRFSTESAMRAHTAEEAGAVLDTVERWQKVFRSVLGRRLVYVADEYYLLAGAPFPDVAELDDLPQHENGVGMAAAFAAAFAGSPAPTAVHSGGFFAAVDGAPAEGYRAPRWTGTAADTGPAAETGLAVDAGRAHLPVPDAVPGRVPAPRSEAGRGAVAVCDRVAVAAPVRRAGAAGMPGSSPARRPVTVVTGEYGARVIGPILHRAGWLAPGGPVHLLPVRNDFFGGTIAVTGLLTGADVARALAAQPQEHRFLLPDVCLSSGRFIDDLTPADLPRPVEVVAADGASLRLALEGAR